MKNRISTVETEVLVVGSEAAGAKAALEAAKSRAQVLVVTKGLAGKSGVTVQAVLTFAAAIDPQDSPEIHVRDTIAGGRYLSDPEIVTTMCHEGSQVIDELEELGCMFARQKENPARYDLVKMPGHTVARGAYTPPAGTTGRKIMATMIRTIRRYPGIQLRSDLMISDLVVADGRVGGALAFDLRTGEPILIRAKAVVIATGGCMEMFAYSAAAAESTGDGFAMAYRAGVPLIDMEFIQFYPVCVVWPKSLWADAKVTVMRQTFEARLLNALGERFMERYDPVNLEKGTRDIVSRACALEILAGRGTKHGGVYLDASYLPADVIDAWIAQHHPGYVFGGRGGTDMLAHGIDIRKEALEVAPFALFYLGGIKTNHCAETDLPGLFAAGEVTGGVHGANRLAGNALLQTHVFGKRAGQYAAEFALSQDNHAAPDTDLVSRRLSQVTGMYERHKGVRIWEVRKRIKEAMQGAWIIKNETSLGKALEEIESMLEKDLPRLVATGPPGGFHSALREAIEVESMLMTADMHIRASMLRTETRGSHYREDYPETDERSWLKNIIVRRRNGQMEFTMSPVPSRADQREVRQ